MSVPAPAPALVPPAPEGYAAFQARNFFGSLDGLRAFSILAVIWHHAASGAFATSIPLLHAGNRGVTLFFAISAFLISTLLLRGKRRGNLKVGRFWCRRALRILPLYFAMLLVYVGVVAYAEHDTAAQTQFFSNLKYFATFTSNWFVSLDGPRVIFYFAWSLAAEEQFYLVWPWVERFLRASGPAWLAAIGLVLTQVAGCLYQSGNASLGLKIASSVPAAILLGVVLAHVLDSRQGFAWMGRIVGHRGSALAAVALAFVALNAEPSLGFVGELVVSLALTTVVAACVVREDNDLAFVLRLRPIAWVGTVSYGIYLMHMLCVSTSRGLLRAAHVDSPVLVFAVSAILAIAAASVSYLTFESFFLRRKERWFGDRASRVPHHPAPPLATTLSATSLSVAK